MKKIIITENSERKLIQYIINEAFSEKVDLVKDFLDKNFLRAANSIIGKSGRPENQPLVIWVDAFKQPKKYMTDVDLFDVLQDEFANILPADEDETEEEEEVKDKIDDILDDAYSEVKKKAKKISHKNRDNFLKQCIKDWYYHKISNNGNLSNY